MFDQQAPEVPPHIRRQIRDLLQGNPQKYRLAGIGLGILINNIALIIAFHDRLSPTTVKLIASFSIFLTFGMHVSTDTIVPRENAAIELMKRYELIPPDYPLPMSRLFFLSRDLLKILDQYELRQRAGQPARQDGLPQQPEALRRR